MPGGLLRRLLLVGVAASLSLPAGAQPVDRPVLLFAAEGDDRAALDVVDARLRAEVAALIGARLLKARAARPSDCDSDPECYVDLAVEQGASLLLRPEVKTGAGKRRLSARLLDENGRTVALAERDVEGAPDEKLLRGVAVQLFEPSRYTGTVRLIDVPQGARVTVDRLPLRARDLVEPLALSVGRHEVHVAAADATVRALPVEVRFQEEATLSLRDAPGEAEPPRAGSAGFPLWPALVTGAVAGVAGITAGVFLVDGLATRADVDVKAAGLPNVKQGGANPHFYAGRWMLEREAQLGDARAAVDNSLRASALSAALAVVSGAVAGALAAAYLAPSGEPAAGE